MRAGIVGTPGWGGSGPGGESGPWWPRAASAVGGSIFSALVNPLNGEHGVMKAVQGNTAAFLAQLQMLAEHFEGKIVDLWVDNASWHKGPRVREFLQPYRRWFHLHYHPPYHPELNPQERIWRRIRYEETTNHYYASAEELECGVLSRVANSTLLRLSVAVLRT